MTHYARSIAIELPYPPTVNHYWRRHQGRTLISAEGRRYRKVVGSVVVQHRALGRLPTTPLPGRLHLRLQVLPPDRRKRDLDNLPKALFDALEHAHVFADDSQIDRYVIDRGRPAHPGTVYLRIAELAENGSKGV